MSTDSKRTGNGSGSLAAGIGDLNTMQTPPSPGGAAEANTLDGAAAGSAYPVDVATGTVLRERYEVRDLVGAGGMGSVYAGWDRLIDHEVALKFLSPRLTSDPKELGRLRHEVRLAQSVTHVNIARTFTVEESDGYLFIVMELLHGPTLADRIRQGPLPVADVVRIGGDLLRGLETAHQRGVIHRDIKPANVTLCKDGRTVLMDFGLARPSTSVEAVGAISLTDTGRGGHTHTQLGGTPGYIAPELITGGRPSVASDLYAVGVLLYEMLSGKPPFSAQRPFELVMKHVDQEPTPITDHCPELPAHLIDTVHRLLRKKPQDRFHSAKDTRHALDPESAELMSSRSIPLPEPTRRNWLWPIVGLAAVAAAAAAIIMITYDGDDDEPSPPPTASSPSPAPAPAPARPANPVADTPPPSTPTPPTPPDPSHTSTPTPTPATRRTTARRTTAPTPPVTKPPPTDTSGKPTDPTRTDRRRRELDLEE